MQTSAAVAFFRLLETPGMLSACTAYQDGSSLAEYEDGDVAAAQGHLSLLRAMRELSEQRSTEHNNSSDNVACASDRSSAGLRLVAGHNGRETGQAPSYCYDDLRFSHCAVDWAATQGHLDVVRWLLDNREEGCTENAVDGACWNGHVQTVRWLVCEWGQEGSERALDYAASTGRLELVKWLSQRGARCTVAAMDGAAGGGHLEVIRWLAANRCEGCSEAAFDMAAAEGRLEVLEWLDGAGLLRCSSMGLDSAAQGGHLDVLQWMLENKPECQCTSNAYGLAASLGRLDVLRWLRSAMPTLQCPAWSTETAAAAGHLAVVEWLHDTGLCQASLALLDDVASEGQLEATMWLNERGARASKAAIDRAAEAGHASVVDYLLKNRQEGCSFEAITGAARNGHLSVVKLLRELRPQQFACCLEARAFAEDNGHVEVVRWLDESDPDLLRALEEAVSECGVSVDADKSSMQAIAEAVASRGGTKTDGEIDGSEPALCRGEYAWKIGTGDNGGDQGSEGKNRARKVLCNVKRRSDDESARWFAAERPAGDRYDEHSNALVVSGLAAKACGSDAVGETQRAEVVARGTEDGVEQEILPEYTSTEAALPERHRVFWCKEEGGEKGTRGDLRATVHGNTEGGQEETGGVDGSSACSCLIGGVNVGVGVARAAIQQCPRGEVASLSSRASSALSLVPPAAGGGESLGFRKSCGKGSSPCNSITAARQGRKGGHERERRGEAKLALLASRDDAQLRWPGSLWRFFVVFLARIAPSILPGWDSENGSSTAQHSEKPHE